MPKGDARDARRSLPRYHTAVVYGGASYYYAGTVNDLPKGATETTVKGEKYYLYEKTYH